MTQDETKTPTITVVLAWLAVGLPLLWGVVETVQKAIKLFVRA